MAVSPVLLAGVVAGLLFFAHSLIPGSGFMPFIWPFLGALLGLLISYKLGHRASKVRESIGSATRTGAVAAIVFFVFALATVLVFNMPMLQRAAETLETEQAVALTMSLVMSVGVTATVGFVCAVLAGVIAGPIIRSFAR
jgi:hypothetical protein